MNDFFDFITGGFFNHIGAAWRKLFSKEKYSVLVQETLSNSIGMFIFTVFLLLVFVVIRFKVL
jgi:hypothetical protein